MAHVGEGRSKQDIRGATNTSIALEPVSFNTSVNAFHPISDAPATPPAASASIPAIPCTLPGKLPGLSKRDITLMQKKQRLLHHSTSQPNQLLANQHADFQSSPELISAAQATLVFAQEEAGTAVCISSEGLLLTCSHCISESLEVLNKSKTHWLLFASGQIVQARCQAWDPKRDLALLQITAAQASPTAHIAAAQKAVAEDTVPVSTSRTLRSRKLKRDRALTPDSPSPSIPPVFPYVSLASSSPAPRTQLYCIGHPGSEDFEAATPCEKTYYDVLHVSAGSFRGYAAGQDVHNNSEIGALMHDCWTYWGHSGAPLVSRDVGNAAKTMTKGQGKVGQEGQGGGLGEGGVLVGLHSSWDDETGMRRGVGWEAIRVFLLENGVTV